MSCPHLTPVDPRVMRTRKLLQDSLRALMRERRLTEISVLDIAEKATVNRATFYAHYTDKQALLISVIKADFQAHMRGCNEDFPSFSSQGLHQIALGVVEFMAQFISQCPAAAQEMATSLPLAIQEETYELCKAWLEAGDFGDANLSLKDTANMLSWGIFGMAFRWSKGERKRKKEAVAQSIVTLFQPAISLPR